jgi:hypothetical protein
MTTNKEKLQCVVRELGYRQRVYARLVEKGKMSELERQNELRLMSAIVDDYRALAADEELPLFASGGAL